MQQNAGVCYKKVMLFDAHRYLELFPSIFLVKSDREPLHDIPVEILTFYYSHVYLKTQILLDIFCFQQAFKFEDMQPLNIFERVYSD